MRLVAVHGNGGGGFRFARMRPHIPPGVGFHAPTLPGFAERPRDPALRTVADYAHRLHSLIPAGEGPLVMLGTGIGGAFALEYAQHYPLDGLILHAPVGTRLDERLFPRVMRLPGVAWLGQRVFASPLTRPLFRRLLFEQPEAIPPDYMRRFFDEYRRCSVFAQMFAIIDAAWFASLQPVEVPAALLWGEKERVLSVDQLDDYKALLPDHVVRTVPEWDHFPMIEQPAAYTREVLTLLNTHIVRAS